MNIILLEKIKSYIERVEMQIEWEWGECRELKELITEDQMPDIYWEVCKLIKNSQ